MAQSSYSERVASIEHGAKMKHAVGLTSKNESAVSQGLAHAVNVLR